MYTAKNYGMMPRTIGGLFEDIFQNGWTKLMADETVATSAPVNIKETDKAYEMQLVAPGLKKEDIKIDMDKNILHISYEHSEEKKDEADGKMLRSEYRFQSFKRSFTMNDKINAAGITAKYADGVLNITLPKKEDTAQPVKTISID